VKLGDVVRKERLRRGLSIEEAAAHVGATVAAYEELEGGASAAETWAPILAAIAVELAIPTSRLLAENGRGAATRGGGAGPLITRHRERRGRSAAEMAQALDLSIDEYKRIEAGQSPIEEVGPLLLKFAELIEQPVFNLIYPCGLPFQSLDDYP